jgi:penicillin-binding protein 2
MARNYSGIEFGSEQRAKIIKYMILLFVILYGSRLGYLQIVKGSSYRSLSEAQAIKQDIIEPFRGNMFDRNGLLMVHNETSFTIRLIPNDFKMDRLPLLAQLLEMDQEEIKKIIDKSKNYSKFEPVRLMRDADFKYISRIEEYNDILQGIDVTTESKRLYDFKGNMAHLLGYTREISKDQLEKKGYYRPGDITGISGIEANYEEFLRGTKGINFVAVNRNGQKISALNNGKSDVKVSNGFDLYLSIDKMMQERAESELGGRRGAAIAIDPTNGEILCFASKPDYDVREFRGKVPADIYNKLKDDEASPLLNRGIQSQYPPGSTWKMLVALACLQEGIINENTTIPCGGSFHYGGRDYKCHGSHGSLNVRRAIQASCNVFFYNLGLRLGIEKLHKYAQMFGFGEKTNVDIPNESRGFMPYPDWFEEKTKKGILGKGSLVNYGIGQGEISVTPMQMAVYAASLANGGTIFQPHVVRAYSNNLLRKVENFDFDSKKVNINPKFFDIIRKGMYDVVNTPGGTAGNVKSSEIVISGKTGTAQNPHGQDHSWFICYAPEVNPKIAVAVIVENAGFGSTAAAPIARNLIDTFFRKDSLSKANASFMLKDTAKKAGNINDTTKKTQ